MNKLVKSMLSILLAFAIVLGSSGLQIVNADPSRTNDKGNRNEETTEETNNEDEQEKPGKGDIKIIFEEDNKKVDFKDLKDLKIKFDDKNIETDEILSVEIKDDHKLVLEFDKTKSDYLFKDKKTEYTVDIKKDSSWVYTDSNNDGSLDKATLEIKVEVFKVQKQDFVKVFRKFPGEARKVFVDNEIIYENGRSYLNGQKYEVTAELPDGHVLIKDPNYNDSYLIESEDKLILDLTKYDKDKVVMHLAERVKIENFFEVDKARVGDSHIGLRLKKSLKDLDIEDLYAIYKGKKASAKMYVTGDNVAVIPLVDNIEKVGDEIYIYAEMKDGSFSQAFMVKATLIPISIEVDDVKAGEKEVTGITEPNAKVILVREGFDDPFEVEADKEGKFKFVFPTALKELETLKIHAEKDDKMLSDTLEIEVPGLEKFNAIKRVHGKDRYKTAVAISKELYPEVNEKRPSTIIIASGENEADALAAGPMAIEYKAPILLVRKGSIPKEVQVEINRLKPSNIIIVGGESSVSKNIENVFKDMDKNVIRLAGPNRFETSIEVAKQLNEDFNYEKVILANAFNSVDALAVSGYAAKNNLAIVLTNQDKLQSEVKKYIEKDEIEAVEIIGGKNSVNEKIEEELGEKFSLRTEGATRFTTAIEIAKKTFPETDMAIVVNARVAVDALSAAPLAYYNELPILLVEKDVFQNNTLKYIKEKAINQLIIIGGENSVGKGIADEFIKLNPPKVEEEKPQTDTQSDS